MCLFGKSEIEKIILEAFITVDYSRWVSKDVMHRNKLNIPKN